MIARIADSVLAPKIMADAVGVSPIAVMFASFAGGELFGLWGLILGIPAAALVRVLFTYFALPWIRAQQVEPPHPAEVVVEAGRFDRDRSERNVSNDSPIEGLGRLAPTLLCVTDAGGNLEFMNERWITCWARRYRNCSATVGSRSFTPTSLDVVEPRFSNRARRRHAVSW